MSEDTKDVKETIQDSSSDKAAAVSVDTGKTEETKDIFEDENKRTIPYSRFKEMVDTKKGLEKQVKQMEKLVEDKVNETARQYQTYYEAELAKINRTLQSNDSLMTEESNPYDGKISELTSQLTNLRSTIENLRSESEVTKFNNEVSKLKDVYPMLDEEHVMAVKKIKPDWSLEECAEYSHVKWDGKIKGKVNEILEKKKEAAKKPVFVSGDKFVLKPEEKPRNLKDAKKKYMEFMKNRERD